MPAGASASTQASPRIPPGSGTGGRYRSARPQRSSAERVTRVPWSCSLAAAGRNDEIDRGTTASEHHIGATSVPRAHRGTRARRVSDFVRRGADRVCFPDRRELVRTGRALFNRHATFHSEKPLPMTRCGVAARLHRTSSRAEEGDMFDLVTGKARHLPSHATLPIFMSTTAQALAVTTILVLPALFVAEQIPEIPTMMAFVAPPPPAPPPPPMQRPPTARPVAQAHPAPS